MIFIAALLGMMVLGTMGLTLANLTATNLVSSQEDLQASQALYVAEGGLQYIIQDQFATDNDFSDNVSPTGAPFGGNPVNLSPGQFWVEYVNLLSTSVTLRVTSQVGNSTRVVQQSLALTPGGFAYVTMAGGNIVMNSSDGDLYGDVGVNGNVVIDDDVIQHGTVTDHASLTLPTMDFSAYSAMTTSTHSGNKTFNSNYSGNLLVTGNCTINANVVITGVLYCNGNINVNGNNVVVDGTLVSGGNFTGDNRSGLQVTGQSPDPNTHMPAIVAGGNIVMNNSDGAVISGLLWAGGNIVTDHADDLQVTGSYIAGGNIVSNHADDILLTFDADLLVGVPGLSALPGGDASSSLSLSDYQTHY